MIKSKEPCGDCTMTIEDMAIKNMTIKEKLHFVPFLLCLPLVPFVLTVWFVCDKLGITKLWWRILDKLGKEEEPVKRKKAFLGSYDNKKEI